MPSYGGFCAANNSRHYTGIRPRDVRRLLKKVVRREILILWTANFRIESTLGSGFDGSFRKFRIWGMFQRRNRLEYMLFVLCLKNCYINFPIRWVIFFILK